MDAFASQCEIGIVPMVIVSDLAEQIPAGAKAASIAVVIARVEPAFGATKIALVVVHAVHAPLVHALAPVKYPVAPGGGLVGHWLDLVRRVLEVIVATGETAWASLHHPSFIRYWDVFWQLRFWKPADSRIMTESRNETVVVQIRNQHAAASL